MKGVRAIKKERNYKPQDSNKEEKCVVCGANTGYKFGTPINDRSFYVEGVGQLCQNCHYEIYEKKNME